MSWRGKGGGRYFYFVYKVAVHNVATAAAQCIEKRRLEENFVYNADTPNLSSMGGH